MIFLLLEIQKLTVASVLEFSSNPHIGASKAPTDLGVRVDTGTPSLEKRMILKVAVLLKCCISLSICTMTYLKKCCFLQTDGFEHASIAKHSV